MSDHERMRRKRLGDILVDEGIAEKEAVIAALHEQQKSRRLLSDILIAKGDLDERNLARALVAQLQTPFIEVSSYQVHKDLVKEFPPQLLYDHALLPLDRFGGVVCFACQETPTAEVAEQLKLRAPGGIFLFIGVGSEIRAKVAEVVPVEAPAPLAEKGDPLTSEEEDSAWKALFDSADASVLQELTEPEPE
jgi:hypothetical protein